MFRNIRKFRKYILLDSFWNNEDFEWFQNSLKLISSIFIHSFNNYPSSMFYIHVYPFLRKPSFTTTCPVTYYFCVNQLNIAQAIELVNHSIYFSFNLESSKLKKKWSQCWVEIHITTKFLNTKSFIHFYFEYITLHLDWFIW